MAQENAEQILYEESMESIPLEAAEAQSDDTICEQIETVEQALRFILLTIIAVCLSYYSTSIQKEQLCCFIEETPNCEQLPDTFPIRMASSILVLISVIYFFGLSKEGLCAEFDNWVSERSACVNHLASFFVLVAAVIRAADLLFVHFHTQDAEPLQEENQNECA